MLERSPTRSIENRVVVRIWKNADRKFGHVSLQTRNGDGSATGDGVYVSIYPTGQGVALLDRQGRNHKTKTLEQDNRKYKDVDPHPMIIELYSLNVTEIETEFHKLKNAGFNFSILSSSIFKHSKAHNCCSLVFHLLQIAGIDTHLSWFSRLKLEAMRWAPSGAMVALAAAPFAIFACSRIAQKVTETVTKRQQSIDLGNILAVKRILDHIKQKEINTSQAGNPSPSPSSPPNSSNTIPSVLPAPVVQRLLRKDISMFGWILSGIAMHTGSIGLTVSVVITLAATGYTLFAGVGTLSNLALITPNSLVNFVKEAQKIEETSRNNGLIS